MYKKQMVFQKILCLVTLISGGIVFMYSLGIMTDLFDSLYSTMRKKDLTQTTVPGSYLYYEMQGFNQLFVKLAIGLILVTLLLFITNTNTRRKYYVGNYVAIALNAIYGIGFTIWAHMQIEFYKAKFLQIDFVALKEHAETWDTLYTDSTFWFDVHYLVFGIVLVLELLLILNLFWKRSLMKEEASLIGKGKEAAA
ncbi:MAG: hypothetical protein II477_10845 [Lachnospiraceae bacterium]|nr:hypothetical protein [Lachnospiraceae bacterium]